MNCKDAIAEASRLKGEAEAAMMDAITIAISAYRDKTGLTPSGIDVQLAESTTFEDTRRHFICARVSMTVSI